MSVKYDFLIRMFYMFYFLQELIPFTELKSSKKIEELTSRSSRLLIGKLHKHYLKPYLRIF